MSDSGAYIDYTHAGKDGSTFGGGSNFGTADEGSTRGSSRRSGGPSASSAGASGSKSTPRGTDTPTESDRSVSHALPPTARHSLTLSPDPGRPSAAMARDPIRYACPFEGQFRSLTAGRPVWEPDRRPEEGLVRPVFCPFAAAWLKPGRQVRR